MNKSTLLLQRTLIRLAKGMLTAWERWLDELEGIRPLGRKE